ncbi:hypothetical protein C8R44DRAFT_365764 [Mycena epipterygia]|nr:hypothetical protein C8R44DRAFT_365764 [Mycena epipterygia]
MSSDARNTSYGRKADTRRRAKEEWVVRPPTRSACSTKKRRHSQEKPPKEALPKRHRTITSPRGMKERVKPGILHHKDEAEANRKEVIRNRNAPAKGLPATTAVCSCNVFARRRKALPVPLLITVLILSSPAVHGLLVLRFHLAFGVDLVWRSSAWSPRKERAPPDLAPGWCRRASASTWCAGAVCGLPLKGTHPARHGDGLVQASWRGDTSQYRVRITEEGNKTKENVEDVAEEERGEGDAGKRPQETQNAGRETSRYKGGTREESHKKRGEEVEKMTSAREAGCRVLGNEGQRTEKLAKKQRKRTSSTYVEVPCMGVRAQSPHIHWLAYHRHAPAPAPSRRALRRCARFPTRGAVRSHIAAVGGGTGGVGSGWKWRRRRR